MRTKPFNLLSLPSVALLKVLNNLGPSQLARLASCSNRAQECAQNAAKVSEIVVKLGEKLVVELLISRRVWKYTYTVYKRALAFIALYHKMFGWKVDVLVINPSHEMVPIVGKFLKRIREFQSKEAELVVQNIFLSVAHKALIFATCGPKKLVMKNLHLMPTSRVHENVEELTLKNGHIYAEHLLVMNCTTIIFSNVSLCGGLCWFIKHWQSGSNRKLEVITGTMNFSSWNSLIESISGSTMVSDDVTRNFKNGSGSVELQVKGGYDVQRYDGVVGTVCSFGGKKFAFVVWRDTL